MRNFKFVCAIICGAFMINSAMAMDLSLNDAVEKVVAESHDLKKAEANVKKAQAQLDAVNANRWVNISANASYMNMVADCHQNWADLSVRHYIQICLISKSQIICLWRVCLSVSQFTHLVKLAMP